MKPSRLPILALLCSLLLCGPLSAQTKKSALPGQYFRLLAAGAARVETRLNAQPNAGLKLLETGEGWRHFPYAILAPAVLYAKRHPQNPHYRAPQMRDLAIRIGDLLANEHEKGLFEPRGDSDWDTYMWLEAWRILQSDLGPARRARWQRCLEENVVLVFSDAAERYDFAWYNSPYTGTSPNHYALYAANLLLAGRLFGNRTWEELGLKILRRFSLTEQTSDGYWGEHSRSGPTIGYNHLTLSAVALYWEYARDPAALAALRRATTFHENFTWPDGTPVETVNDRNRHWGVSAWSHFAFSNFPDGRRYAEFLTGFFRPETLTMESLGRLAQGALYYHEGPASPIPQDRPQYSRQMNIPAGIRKTAPWVVALSGIIDTQAINSQFYLDRQAHLAIFHEKLGQIISGANSKRQPELATFSEKLLGQVVHMPLSSRLQMSDRQDRLSLAFNTFFSDLYIPRPDGEELSFKFVISGRGTPAEEPRLTLQLRLHPGETLETGAGRRLTLGADRIELNAAAIGGWIRHHGWTMKVDPAAQLIWPVYPHNPYANAPETKIEHAVGALSVPLRLKSRPGHYIRPNEQEISFTLRVGE
ncbi:MAG: hypothetical protein SF339_16065 [Blastocatellia bacterium]|nr:hypothetical protein [Blastocatellia bacterium]